MRDSAKKIHKQSIVVDFLTGTFSEDFNEQYVENLKESGISAIRVTIQDVESYDMSQVVDEFGKWVRILKSPVFGTGRQEDRGQEIPEIFR